MKRFIENVLFVPAFFVFYVVLKLALWRKDFCRWVERKRKNGTRNL